MLAFLFPGQGAQSEGFLHRLPELPVIDATLSEASDVLGVDVRSLDTAEALQSTVAVQVGLVIAGVATVRGLAESALTPDLSAGLSVGAYAAAVSSGALAFDAALKMVRKRAQLMESAYPSGYGLAAISGLAEHQLERLAQEHVRDGYAQVYIGNVNAPRQIVMAGENRSLDAFIERARAVGARKAIRLAVSVPSHCALLAQAADALSAYARDVAFAAPVSGYVGNRRARLLSTADAVRDDLASNMRYTVRWFDAMSVMVEMGVKVFVEAPPGQVSSDILRDEVEG